MKTKLLKRLRRKFKVLQHGNMYSYKYYSVNWAGASNCQSEWTNDREGLMKRYREDLLSYAYRFYGNEK